jgi:hypothetical protein
MANTKILNAGDKLAAEYNKRLDVVLRRLDRQLVDIVSSTDAIGILNDRAAIIGALETSGYNALNAQYIAQYEAFPQIVKDSMKARSIPLPQFTPADAEIFAGLARADLQAFTAIGRNAMDELRIGLYKQAVSNQPFSALVRSIAAATVGVDGKGSPMANHARTIANTAVLDFGGEVLRVSGENIFDQLGIPEDEQLWEAVGPIIDTSRQSCIDAIEDNVRTKAAWLQHTNEAGEPWWGGTPGGFNCQHQLFPVLR